MTGRWRVLGAILAVALSGYFVWFAIRSLDLVELSEAFSSGDMFIALLAAALLYAMVIPITAWAWASLLSSRSEVWRPGLLAEILGLSQLAKYVPGNIAQHAARLTVSMRHGMKAGVLLSSVAQETVLAIAASLIVGMTALVISGYETVVLSPKQANALLVLGGLLLVVVAICSLWKNNRVEMLGDGVVGNLIRALAAMPGWRATCVAILAYSVNYLLIGLGLWCIAIALDSPHALSYSAVTAAFSLSWVLGFMTPGAPAGLGAREAVMLLVLHGAASPETLTTFVLLARLATILGDVISFVVALALYSLRKRIGVHR